MHNQTLSKFFGLADNIVNRHADAARMTGYSNKVSAVLQLMHETHCTQLHATIAIDFFWGLKFTLVGDSHKKWALIPPTVKSDDQICAICDGGPGNDGVCLCGMRAWEGAK